MTIDWEQRKLSGYFNGELIGQTDIPSYFSLVSTSGTNRRYGRGGFAVFGETPLTDEDSALTTKSNNGIDDIIIAHSVLDLQAVQAAYAREIAAYSPVPSNGGSFDFDTLYTLNWKSHTNLNLQLKEYRVRLSTDETLANPVIDVITTSNAYTLPSLTEAVYYWSVDIVLNDNTVITGEVWSVVDTVEEQLVLLSSANKSAFASTSQVQLYDEDLYNFEGDMDTFESGYSEKIWTNKAE